MEKSVILVRSSAFRTSRLAKTASALHRAGYRPSILSWKRTDEETSPPPLRERLEDEGFPIDEVWVGEAPYARGIWGLPKRWQYIWRVMQYVRANDFDAVHAVDLDSALPVALAQRIGWHTGVFVFDIADYIELYYTIPDIVARMISVVNRWVMHEADHIILPDENREDGLPSAYKSKTTIVTNAPDLDEELLSDLRNVPSITENLDLFYYGSLAEDRGIDVLLDAAGRLPHVNVWFAGWGNMATQIAQVASEQGNVHFLGSLSHEAVMERVAAMDLIVIMYDPEYGVNQMASPNKLFEAMALGKPVVVARDTSIDVLVEGRKMGWAVDYSAKALVALIRSIDATALRERGKHSQAAYNEYAWPKSEERLVQSYEHLLGKQA